MTSFDMKKALLMSVPQRMPRNSRFWEVEEEARERNLERRFGGRNMVRRGVPDSRKAEGLKVKSRGFTSGVAVEERGRGIWSVG